MLVRRINPLMSGIRILTLRRNACIGWTEPNWRLHELDARFDAMMSFDHRMPRNEARIEVVRELVQANDTS